MVADMEGAHGAITTTRTAASSRRAFATYPCRSHCAAHADRPGRQRRAGDVAESDQIVAEMQRRNIPVTYVFYRDEGHGFRRPENRRSFTAVVEAFLAQHLGGAVSRSARISPDRASSSAAGAA